MPWIVKLDKEEDFVGRWALERARATRRRRRARRLHARRRRRPARGRRGARRGGAPAGRVTSSRYSRAARRGDRPWPGCRPRWPRDGARVDDLRRRGARHRRASPRARSTTPRGRCCARERSTSSPPRVRRRRALRPVAAQPDGAPGAGGGRALRGARRLAGRDELRRSRARARALPRSAGYADRSDAGQARAPGRARGAARRWRAARSRRARHVRTGDGWWCPLARDRALRLAEPAATAPRTPGWPRPRAARRARRWSTSPRPSRRSPSSARCAREVLARLTRAGPAPAGRPGRRLPARIGRPRARRWCCCEAPRALPRALRRRATPQYVWTVLADAAAHLGGGADRRRRADAGGGRDA